VLLDNGSKNSHATLDVFKAGWVGLEENVKFDVLDGKLNMDAALNIVYIFDNIFEYGYTV
jgi:hypothetical protein